jgi:hypothetical protein
MTVTMIAAVLLAGACLSATLTTTYANGFTGMPQRTTAFFCFHEVSEDYECMP